ncbi:MAG: type I DNA topoisomerase [Acidobacteria bacterium]|jgi:DNA topoisomerase-1|nr:MAG: type I DNA topoisomerase [Acidobacteriota bacterium]GIU82010.1 MAG: DNA topoisomerase 1 [Pyrinomonadaceae bacterium]
MAKNLVIVESPAKAKTINKYLGKDYRVLASIGHIKDLPPDEFGVDIKRGFEPKYELIPDDKKPNNKKIVNELKKAAQESEAVYLAADPDREGEAICQHLAEEVVSKKAKIPVYRVRFNEITEKAIREAFANPRQIDQNLVNAQQARRVLDRIVGYQVSPLLWRTLGGRLSAGRVQTVALRLVVEREREIQNFVPTEYWTITANLSSKLPPDFDARLYKIDDKVVKTSDFDKEPKASEFHIKDEKTAQEIVAEAQKQDFVVDSVTKKERKRSPTPPFITSKLQQEASRKLGFSPSRTMKIAQRLYEGIELGAEGSVGLITYMRTDSVRISEDALAQARAFIKENFGQEYLPPKPNVYKTNRSAQDAHEAIRPTDVHRTPESLQNFLSDEELKLYTLIWKRFVASQMSPAIFDQTTIDVKAGKFIFRATGSVQKFDGFLRVYQEGRDESDDEDEERKLPEVEKGERLRLNHIEPKQSFTEPPPRYTEATLVKALEEKGIGRPSTYATILSTIQEREYVEKIEGKLHPTPLGIAVSDLLVASFEDIFNETYTARLEEELDKIEEGKLDWRESLKRFYEKFSKDLKKAEEDIKSKKKSVIPTDETCEKCGAKMVIRFGRYGEFMACSNYPKCKNTREVREDKKIVSETEIPPCEVCGREMVLRKSRYGMFYGCVGYPQCKNTRKIGDDKKQEPVDLEEVCPKCGSKMQLRQGRFGKFTACSNYPKCDYVKQETLGIQCPECKKGEIVVKRSKRGKTFYGCSEYPNCNAVFWNKPLLEACPNCSATYLFEKSNKKGVKIIFCGSCSYKRHEEMAEKSEAA